MIMNYVSLFWITFRTFVIVGQRLHSDVVLGGGGGGTPSPLKVDVIFNTTLQKFIKFKGYSVVHNNTIINLNSIRLFSSQYAFY